MILEFPDSAKTQNAGSLKKLSTRADGEESNNSFHQLAASEQSDLQAKFAEL